MKITIDFKDATVEKPNPKSQYEHFLIVDKSGWIAAVPYNRKFDMFNAASAETLKEAKQTAIYPKWWAEIPPELLAQEDYDGQTE